MLNAIFSGLALIAVVVTFWMQFSELRSQRAELADQRESLIRTQEELHRSAEANLRRLHVDLVKMSIDDPQLAMVWPQVTESAARDRQYQYANLILQHNWLQLKISDFSAEEMERAFRYLFSSPAVGPTGRLGESGLLHPQQVVVLLADPIKSDLGVRVSANTVFRSQI